MAHYLYRSESQEEHVRVLHQPQVPGFLLSVLQGGEGCAAFLVAGEGHPERVRVAEECVSGYEGVEEWFQGVD